MADNQYPVFEGGQTLTADDLNSVRAFLHQRDRLLGRLIGFGINCGLGGSVSGTTLTITPGLAIDQVGEPLLLGASQTIALPPPPVTPSYDFIDTAQGGFSVVLEATDTVVPAPDCGEPDCAGHADLHTRDVALRVVAGRVTGTHMDFAAESLLTVEPMRLSLDSSPLGSYTALRNAIATRLTNGGSPLVNPALITALQATSIGASDLPGTKGYKCGWINMVLFAALDLLRCEALMELACDRSTTRPGVVLGWVHQVSSTWQFDCAYRHAWEPPRGFTETYLGGTCTDPCGVYRDALEGLLAGYAPPDPPPPGGGGVPPVTYCPNGLMRVGDKCVNIYYPPPDIPDYWIDVWIIDPLGPIWNPPDVFNPSTIYEIDDWNYFGDGVISGVDLVGQPGVDVKTVLDVFIEGKGVTPTILMGTATEVRGMSGYLPSGGFSPSDTIVLTLDGAGAVIATGRVSAARNTREVGAALPAAMTAVADAKGAVAEVKGLASTLSEGFSKLHEEFAGFDSKIGGLINDRVSGQLLTLTSRVSTVEGAITVLGKSGGLRADTAPGLDKDFGEGVLEFTQTAVAAMKTLTGVQNRNFTKYVAATERAQAKFDIAMATDNPAEIGATTIELLDTVRTMVKASGVDAGLGRQLDVQFRAVQDKLR
jgi:hypothetical protein